MKIYLDSGHRNNEYDYGAVYNSYKEAALAVLIANELKPKLENLGVTVYMSRTSDADIISLDERTKQANALNVDLFLSIHLNAFNGSASGTLSLYYNDPTLAKLITNCISNNTGAINRGATQRQDLHVLRESNMEAVLTETVFIDCLDDV